MEVNRRGLITGLISFVAVAPAIVRASSIMSIKPFRLDRHPLYDSDEYQMVRENFYGRSPAMNALPDLYEIEYRLRKAMGDPERRALTTHITPRGKWIRNINA